MRKLFYSSLILVITSCSIAKNQKEVTLYESIIQDIKSSNEFKNYESDYENTCSIFEIDKYARTICMFDIESLKSLNPKSIDLIDYYDKINCKALIYDANLTVNLSKDLSLQKYSDKSEPCFKLWFSEIINNKVIVEIKNLNTDSFSSTTMNFIYKINTDNSVELIEIFKAMVN